MDRKGWAVRKVSPGFSSVYNPTTGQITTSHDAGYTDYAYNDYQPYEHGQPNVLSKRIAEYNGWDVIALFVLLVTMICVSGLLTWLLVRVLSDPSKSFQDWRSNIDKLFRRRRLSSHRPQAVRGGATNREGPAPQPKRK